MRALICILAIALVSGVTKSRSLRVKFCNKTGHDLDSLAVQKVYIGTLPRDSATAWLPFSGFLFDTGSPIEVVSGKIGSERSGHRLLSICGTEWHTETSGRFVFDIVLFRDGGEKYLELRHHEP